MHIHNINSLAHCEHTDLGDVGGFLTNFLDVLGVCALQH